MSEPALRVGNSLRVHVDAPDPARRAALEDIVLASGHTLAAMPAADVILSDGDCTATHAPVVAIGAHDDGQAGLLGSNATPVQVDAALRAAAAGLIVRTATEFAFTELPEPPLPLLTPRETEVLAAISEGFSNKEIARRLEISLHTVKFHIESLLRKLGARSRAEAVAKGLTRRTEL